jgi:hypothetical protein
VPRISDQAVRDVADVIIREAERLAIERRSCGSCSKPLPLIRTGRPAEYCSPACRKRAHYQRRTAAHRVEAAS